MIPITLARNRLVSAQAPPMRQAPNNFGVNLPIPRQQMPPAQNPFQLGGGPFGVNTQLPGQDVSGQVFNQPPPQQPQQDPQFDFMGQYQKIAGNRPNRLAYQQAVQEGAPVINRGKWAKLGAAIAAAGGSMGPGGAQAGAQLGLSSYMAPQERADAAYKQRVSGLGQLAQFEDTDKAAEIQQLENQRGDLYKQEDLKLRKAQSEREEKQTAADIRTKILSRLKPIEKTDGNTYLYDMESGQEKLVGKTGFTPDELIDQKKRELTMELTTKDPFLAKQYNREQGGRVQLQGMQEQGALARQILGDASSERNVSRTVEGRNTVAETKASADREKAASRLRTAASVMKPDDIKKSITVDLADEIEAGTVPPSARQYLDFDENGTPYAKSGIMYDEDVSDAVTKFIARSIRKSRAGNTGGAPASNVGTTSSGGRYTIKEVK